MKKYTLIAVVFCFTAFLFCCKTYKGNEAPGRGEIIDDEVSAYLHSANGVMHQAPVAEKNTAAKEITPAGAGKEKKRLPHFAVGNGKISPAVNPPELTPKEQRKAIRALLKKQAGDDGDGIGIAIGLIILYLLLGILIIAGLIYLIAIAANNSSNNSNNTGNGSGSGSNSGCYVATMVYGSYEAPEVMVLRKFRDETLAHSRAGRAFIRWYYGWSPGFVAKYNHLGWLHKLIKVILDRLVKFLS